MENFTMFGTTRKLQNLKKTMLIIYYSTICNIKIVLFFVNLPVEIMKSR